MSALIHSTADTSLTTYNFYILPVVLISSVRKLGGRGWLPVWLRLPTDSSFQRPWPRALPIQWFISAKQSQGDPPVKPFKENWIDSHDMRCCKTYNKLIDLLGNLSHFSYHPYKGFKVNRWLYGGDYLVNKGHLGCGCSKQTSLAGWGGGETKLVGILETKSILG